MYSVHWEVEHITKSPARILMIAGLADSMLNSILAPILTNESILVDVMRTTPGTPKSGVSYICPPVVIRKNTFLSLIWKALASLHLALTASFSCIYVVHAFPHLYLGTLTSYISKKPLVYMVIASRFEFSVHGPVIERLTIGLARRANRLIVSNVDIVEFLI
ncbi:MAG: hypothetical protein AM325_016125, partial [Candidatus Thorarchaeota archaeon SMTZ1-45]